MSRVHFVITPSYRNSVLVLFGSYEMQLRKSHQSYVTRKVSIYFMMLFSASKLSQTNACVILSDSDAFHTDDMTSLIWCILNVELSYFISCSDKNQRLFFAYFKTIVWRTDNVKVVCPFWLKYLKITLLNTILNIYFKASLSGLIRLNLPVAPC